ncbi:MAG: hypothetical protein IKZ84_10930, partial [Victivallales bacterium]|nr:hypothetical protein [Victivallales bacterium]
KHSLPKDETATHSMTIPLALANFKKSENADGSVERRDFAGAGLYYNSSYSPPGSSETPQTSYWHAIPFYAKTVKPEHTRVTAAIPPISYDHGNSKDNNEIINDRRAIASPHRWFPLFKTYSQTICLADADPNYLLSGHWLFPFYSVKTSMTFDETEDTVTDDKPLEANDSDVAANDVKQDVETAKTEETTASADTIEKEETAETNQKETPQRPIKNYASKTTLGAGIVY